TTQPLELSPNAQVTLTFLLTEGGHPVAGQTVSFTTIGSSTTGAQGATVAEPSGVTGADGSVSVIARAGLADFRVEAQIGTAKADVTIIVATGPTGTVLVEPFVAPSSSPLPPDTTIDVTFYPSSCAELDLDAPPPTVRGTVTLNGLGSSARFDVVSTTGISAAVGRASAGGALVASGCVDIPGSILLANETVEVALPLTDWSPDPVGTYTVTSTLKFAPPLAAAAALAAPWSDLSDCPLDPAQLWLDCTVDALSPATSADPLDCVPSTAPGGEGPLGDAIAALRGVPLADGAGGPPLCRSAQDAAGNESLDALALGLFGSPTPAQLIALPAIAADAASILDSFQLVSQLTVAPGGTAGSYVVTHLLTGAAFGPAAQVPVTLASLALPVLQAYTSATVSDQALVIGSHGFTLRLGTAARAAFGPLALVPRGLPADVPSFVSALFSLAQTPGGTTTGCAALDGLVCPAVARPVGCLMSACLTGLGALAGKLDGAFATADGTGLDLMLSGTAPLIEKSGGGLADRLGSDGTGTSPAATWSVNLRTGLGSAQITATFAGRRN
ncbi:MAG TPA: hypothetical protein VLA79_07710, partial [Polyangia bacterium]|nr:hypothetical protein [Polyangia bacterium]